MSSFDRYFLDVCTAVAKNSKCLSRQIGAILVRDKSIISTGYNGPPRGVMHCVDRIRGGDSLLKDKILLGKNDESKCPRQLLGYLSGEGLEWCIAGHAERNALINAARNGIETNGAKMYMTCGIPCKDCLIEIINAGIEELIVTKELYYDNISPFLVKQSKIKVRVYDLS